MAGRFELKRANGKEFFFMLISETGEIAGKSEMYKAKANAQKGIAAVKTNAPDPVRFKEPWRNNNGQWHFALKARNGEVILVSQGYSSEDGAMAAISTVQRAADGAPTRDMTKT